ncbi:prepilin-type N-terminal cleavage/methylation domain-containing protein [Thermus scotoductus]|uniref:Uncharacterized protein n=2 Tax=Thermus TaxID=270 RepID=H7GEJ9_9DEIN|nr:prepilin-type N-terminal cleavage/methylation domain-containing protein [Thermus scotoductus]EIA39596.1 hypothetical protein RLTM_02566 [Thermus parvatiensis]RTG96264.1 prepilin-type N-terminal cleavage/methylation domain-containing protein [Thermus scotoductus]RTH01401.1 prepilin-type N-terminal cleavage/methylation domain-containing protein [Thermus scotoductus]RTH15804.1 prepilin-type N-terminal cleavage/methylation domain-containing protein [Thermus scotoductus]RTI02465.1 prepilin-type 
MRERIGFTLLEFLIVLGLLGLLLSIGALSTSRLLRSEERSSFLTALQTFIWQGATEAASRGEALLLDYDGSRLRLLRESNKALLRALPLPQGASLSLNQGPILRYSPPGKVENPDGSPLNGPLTFTLSLGGQNHRYTVSLIGEVKKE